MIRRRIASALQHLQNLTVPSSSFGFCHQEWQHLAPPYQGSGVNLVTDRSLQTKAQKRERVTQISPDLASWLLRELTMAPNVVSLARLISGPCIAALIVHESWSVATISLILAGASDWLDGFLAKTWKYQSMLGSFLDPLADKALICSTAGALVYQGLLPVWAAFPVIARDVSLVLGTYVHFTISGAEKPMTFFEHLQNMKQKGVQQGYAVQPLFISKVNTAVQLSLVASCMGHGWIQWPSEVIIDLVAKLTVLSTLASWGTYTWGYFVGNKVIS